jgi:FkbM family methyltransferase
MDPRIDFKTAQRFGQVELIDWHTKYGDFQLYVRRGLNEVKYNVGQNFARNPKSGEYIYPFSAKNMGGAELNIDSLLNREDTWLDIGGHLGFFPIRMVRQFPRIKKVVSYEALPHNVTFALENLKLNGVTNCEMIQKAISPDDRESVDFFISNDSGKHSILRVKGRESIQVPSININAAIEQSGATAIKMDVEGAEYYLIQAVRDWSNIRLAVIEWHFNAMKSIKSGTRASLFQDTIRILENNFDEVRRIPGVEHGKHFITHFAAIKFDK